MYRLCVGVQRTFFFSGVRTVGGVGGGVVDIENMRRSQEVKPNQCES